ncbi:MAG: IS110 family transposase, partial [Chloroflexi bacterium]|nr:IS110 family transposase [Chloroflexota bacterium]
MDSIVYGGLDVHKESISICLLVSDTGEIIEDRLINDGERVKRAAKRWQKLGELRLCYEASGCGFVLKRLLNRLGISCEVIAPSLIPKAPGNHTKTDKRDAKQLALLYRAGMLSIVRTPGEDEEMVRALVRLRAQLTADIVRVKNRLTKYLRTIGQEYSGKNWSQGHKTWLRGLKLKPIEETIVSTHLNGLDDLARRREEIDRQIEEIAQSEPYRAAIDNTYSAMVLISEIGDCRRFSKPTQLMSYLGLVPRESSSGEKRKTGSITKTGNSYARWVLGEAAWNQMRKVGKCERVRRHWKTQPEEVVAIGKRAAERLHYKFWRV